MRLTHDLYESGNRLSHVRVVPACHPVRGSLRSPVDIPQRLKIERLECLCLGENRFLAVIQMTYRD
jgi:hypothetical protein